MSAIKAAVAIHRYNSAKIPAGTKHKHINKSSGKTPAAAINAAVAYIKACCQWQAAA